MLSIDAFKLKKVYKFYFHGMFCLQKIKENLGGMETYRHHGQLC